MPPWAGPALHSDLEAVAAYVWRWATRMSIDEAEIGLAWGKSGR